MSLVPEAELPPRSPSPAESESASSTYSEPRVTSYAAIASKARRHSALLIRSFGRAPADRYQARDAQNSQHTPTLPPLRAFLRGEGIDSNFAERNSSNTTLPLPTMLRRGDGVSPAHAEAREAALQRALGSAAQRPRPAPPLAPCHSYENMRSSSYRGDRAVSDPERERRERHDRADRVPNRAASYGEPPRASMPYTYAPPQGPSPYTHYSQHGPSPYTHYGHAPLRHTTSHSSLGSAHAASHPLDAYRMRGPIDSGYNSGRATPASDVYEERELQPLANTQSRKRKVPIDFRSDSEEEDDEDDYEEEVVVAPKPRRAANARPTNARAPAKTRAPARQPAKRTAPKKAGNAARSTPSASSADGDSENRPELARTPEGDYLTPEGIKLEVIELPIAYDEKGYLAYVAKCENGDKKWRCTWETMKNGAPSMCDYSAKKHLVKRHIEATHMRIKRFQCTWCGKTFTQRSNVAGCHLNTHTGEAPHKCEFCDESFKDPSKRHKHMTRDHRYRPSKGRKKFKADEESQRQSPHESLPPWLGSGNISPSQA